MHRQRMIGHFLVLAGLLAAVSPAADRPRWFEAQLEDVEFKVRLIRDPQELQSLFGSDLDREFIVAEIEVQPLYNARVDLKRDDFLLRSYRNNDRSYAQSPDRIAGESVLVMGTGRVRRGAGVFSESQDPILVGGAPGTGTRPRRVDNPGSTGIGGSTTSEEVVQVKEQKQSSGSLRGRLEQMELPMGETRTKVKGYLYFQMNPKTKWKHLALTYDGNAGECKIAFK